MLLQRPAITFLLSNRNNWSLSLLFLMRASQCVISLLACLLIEYLFLHHEIFYSCFQNSAHNGFPCCQSWYLIFLNNFPIPPSKLDPLSNSCYCVILSISITLVSCAEILCLCAGACRLFMDVVNITPWSSWVGWTLLLSISIPIFSHGPKLLTPLL